MIKQCPDVPDLFAYETVANPPPSRRLRGKQSVQHTGAECPTIADGNPLLGYGSIQAIDYTASPLRSLFSQGLAQAPICPFPVEISPLSKRILLC